MAWARAVKARQTGARRGAVPPLWLFTEERRTADLVAAVAALPAGLCGVVFRHDGAEARGAMLRRVGLICRERRLALVVAGDRRGAPAWAGWHLRRGRGRRLSTRFVTSSAHTTAEMVRAQRAGVNLVFLSPLFRTESHVGARPLGVMRWSATTTRIATRIRAACSDPRRKRTMATNAR